VEDTVRSEEALRAKRAKEEEITNALQVCLVS
jgi:hypothetical protein